MKAGYTFHGTKEKNSNLLQAQIFDIVGLGAKIISRKYFDEEYSQFWTSLFDTVPKADAIFVFCDNVDHDSCFLRHDL